MATTVTIENTPGGRWFVRIEPPHEDYPARSFDTYKQARDYKWLVDLRIGREERKKA
jgi:hypothetical protein